MQKVDFPVGHVWIDVYNGDSFSGGTSEQIPLTSQTIPVFVRAGAIIPSLSDIPNTDEYHSAELTFEYYHHTSVVRDASVLYEDDGKTPDAYEKGLYKVLKFSVHNTSSALKIEFTLEGKTSSGIRENSKYKFKLRNIPNAYSKIICKDQSGKIFQYNAPVNQGQQDYDFEIPFLPSQIEVKTK